MANDQHIPVLYGKYIERIEAAGKFESLNLTVDDLFKTVSSMKSIDEPWLITELRAISDMSVDDITHCTKYDDDAVLHLITFAVGLSPTHKLHENLQIKNVLHRLMCLLNGRFGSRLKGFKSSGAPDKNTGKISWQKGCYTGTYNKDDVLETCSHIGGYKVSNLTDWGIKKPHALQDNFSDFGAYFHRKPMAPIKAHLLFKADKKGPYKLPQVQTAAAKDFVELVAQCRGAFDSARAGVASGSSTEIAQITQALTKVSKEKRTAQAMGNQEKAAKAIEAKRAKRSTMIG